MWSTTEAIPLSVIIVLIGGFVTIISSFIFIFAIACYKYDNSFIRSVLTRLLVFRYNLHNGDKGFSLKTKNKFYELVDKEEIVIICKKRGLNQNTKARVV